MGTSPLRRAAREASGYGHSTAPEGKHKETLLDRSLPGGLKTWLEDEFPESRVWLKRIHGRTCVNVDITACGRLLEGKEGVFLTVISTGEVHV